MKALYTAALLPLLLGYLAQVVDPQDLPRPGRDEARTILSAPLWEVEIEGQRVLVTAPDAQLAAARAAEDLDLQAYVVAEVSTIRGGQVTRWDVGPYSCIYGWAATALEEVPDGQ